MFVSVCPGSLEMNLSGRNAAAAPDRGGAYAEIDEFAVGDDRAGEQLAMALAGQLGDHPAPCGLRRRGKIDAHPWGFKSGYISHSGLDFNLRKGNACELAANGGCDSLHFAKAFCSDMSVALEVVQCLVEPGAIIADLGAFAILHRVLQQFGRSIALA